MARIGPATAHLTAYVWHRNGLSHRALTSLQGRAFYHALAPAQIAYHWFGRGPTFETVLLWRHRLIDLLLSRSIEQGQVTQVLELAAGLSGRGWRFKQRYRDRIVYQEGDLPAMAEYKYRALTKAGLLGPGHDVVTVDVLQDEGDLSLEAVAGRLDVTRGTAIITEGLLNYLPREVTLTLWRRIVTILRGLPAGLYLSDLYVGDEGLQWPASRAFRRTMAALARTQVHVDFDTTEAARQALVACGFAAARVHDPQQFPELAGATPPAGGSLVRVLEGHTGCSVDTVGVPAC